MRAATIVGCVASRWRRASTPRFAILFCYIVDGWRGVIDTLEITLGSDVACPVVEPRWARRRRRLAAYSRAWRGSVAAIVSVAPALEDLADSFPALLFALATDYGTSGQRQRAMACVLAGLPLRVAAEALGLPFWLRRVPAQALSYPLPRMPRDAEFCLVVSSRMPCQAEEIATWFARLGKGLEVVGRDFAMWTARAPRLVPLSAGDEDFEWLLAWAWHSIHPGTRGHDLLRLPWSPAMTWRKAREEVAIWRKRIDLLAALGPGIEDAWLADGRALGFDIVALRTVDDFIAESAAMENCLDQYGRHLALGSVRVFSVRKNGRRIADVELTPRQDDANMPNVSQLRGPRNRRVSAQVWQAVHAWLGSQPIRPLKSEPQSGQRARQVLRSLWQPYLEALQAAIGTERRLPPSPFGLPQRYRRREGLTIAQSTGASGSHPAGLTPSAPNEGH